jgi:endonuclease YncB( thermonuclease family)
VLLPLGNPRRIFVRQPRRFGQSRRLGLRTAGLLLAIAAAAVFVAYPLASGVLPLVLQAGVPHALAADNVAVMDGETLRVGGRVVRLDGVAAPKHGNGCAAGADCAGTAALHLAALVQDRRVACQPAGTDQTSHAVVARCEAGGTDINQALVASGWAEAKGDAPALKQAENTARKRHLGLWAQR